MHDQDPRTEAHDAEERELARIARALPGGGPSPRVDAAVLAAARAATERTSPRRRLSVRWGLGASAAAVLMVGLFWRWQAPDALWEDMLPAAPAPVAAPPAPDAGRERPTVERRQVQAQNEAAPAPPVVAVFAAPAAELPPLEDDQTLAPEPWLERIRARLAAGREDEARRSLRRFVEAHPGHPLPDDLRALTE